ncbi:protein sickie-like [Toxorhynchites rutilus septentrionalis]|uniref:protein sickie-like n=1 Tax=Toxorhynchites rutilus septentrionalis TaxID=329112 RepID=UPI0024790E49|nr:protein sickie-like [Toxorhynchites rutilus septentrionalis]XP_055639314.1 protein sickie-like [Toxorhynchites rutilus septentrionalis]XP_055639315.1 protein sickie-like [Toxorhynchites rutilus septentrionalis]XP_055639316.1 protein sickie-like [Toxorhynchites rutilus septentrionalis]XP_055639317.1 protein sickie-like [Toxorhynchites rutilus septentrionalis]XP_055639318.1 protein sickie-like [Toxorhynchites rutilus septentrionalis]
MSPVKPAAPAGSFATIRTRGLSRSTSRSEQHASSRRNSGNRKSAGSESLYDEGEDGRSRKGSLYKGSSEKLVCVPPPVPPRINSELTTKSGADKKPEAESQENNILNPYRDDDDVYCTSLLTYETFKPLKSPSVKDDMCDYLSLVQSSECIDRLNYDFELPQLRSPQYITELKLIHSKAMESGTLFPRPESPPYAKIRSSYRSTTPESVDNCSSGSSTYSNPIASGNTSSLSGFLGNDDGMKSHSNGKASTLQYRKSYSSSRSEIIYEESRKLLSTGGQSSDTDSGYDGGQSNSYSEMHRSAELLNVDSGVQRYSRGYSTLGHPRDVHIGGSGYPKIGGGGGGGVESKSTGSLHEAHLGKSEQLLDHKIGSQTTLRNKPIIPWYELAIRKDHRQSCPPLQANVVAAFEQSLVSVSQKLHKLTTSTEEKDSEIREMKQTIELLRQQSAGIAATQLLALSAAHGTTTSGTVQTNPPATPTPSQSEMKRHGSSRSIYSSNPGNIHYSVPDKLHKKKGGIRHSITRAFSRNQKGPRSSRPVSQNSNPDLDLIMQSYSSQEDVCLTPQLYVPPLSPTKSSPPSSISPVQSIDHHPTYDMDGNPVVEHLVKQLREKDMVLTDIRLEALTTASQIENLKDTMLKMRTEMLQLKHNNDRLQHIVTRRSISGSDVSLGSTSPTNCSGEPSARRFSASTDYLSSRPPLDLPLNLDESEEDGTTVAPIMPEPLPEPLSPAFIADLSPSLDRSSICEEIIAITSESPSDQFDGKKIAIAVYLGQMDLFARYLEEMNRNGHQENGKIKQNEFTIAFTYVSGKTSWQSLDYIVRRSFCDFLERVDPTGHLRLNTESIACYHIGEAKRNHKLHLPELLPYGYIVGNVDTLYVCLRGVSNVALDNLIIKNMVLRYKSSAVVDPKRASARASMESIESSC